MVGQASHLDRGQTSSACAAKPMYKPPRGSRVFLISSSISLSVALEAFAGADPRLKAEGALTYADVAPILFERCAACHRPDGAAPFSLLTYEEARKRARQIAEVVQRRYMPPWLPEPGHGDFAGSRRLNDREVTLIKQWVTDGAREGEAAPPPPMDRSDSEWQLGEPDLILQMAEPFTLQAEGRDVFRNFVIPAGVSSPKYVRAVEFRVRNSRPVHHANLKIDLRQAAREADARDPGPGFDGIDFIDADFPDGHIIGWTPGKAPFPGFQDLAWRLPPEADLVLMLHMVPTGKPEPVEISIGLFFADKPPARHPYSVRLGSQSIDIPPGQSRYEVRDSYVLPVDVEALTIYPHAHYLGREIQATATLPDKTTKPLLLIKQWDFNWQDEYRYAQPVSLPRGTRLDVRITYDNSTSNAANPNLPPQRIVYGPLSTDEMGDVWIQLLPRTPGDVRTLTDDFLKKELQAEIAGLEATLRRDPEAYSTHEALARRYLLQRRNDLAIQHLKRAIEINPQFAVAHSNLGIVYQLQGNSDEALACFRRAVQCGSSHAQSHLNLGLSLQARGETQEAVQHLRRAVELKPSLSAAHTALADAWRSQGNVKDALHHYHKAVSLAPENAVTRHNYGTTLLAAGDLNNARQQFIEALKINPSLYESHTGLARTLRFAGDREGALRHFQESIRLHTDNPPALMGAAWILATHPEASQRQPVEAVRLAERALHLTQQKDPAALETLAVAYASAGNFAAAISAQKAAIALVKSRSGQLPGEGMNKRLQLFEQGRPYVETASSPRSVSR